MCKNNIFIWKSMFISKIFFKFGIEITINKNTMKGLTMFAAVIGGATIGFGLGLLFAPAKGKETRAKIAEKLKERGLKLNKKEMECLVDDITNELKAE